MPSKSFHSAASAIFLQRDGGYVVGLVGVEIEVEAVLDGERKDEVEQFLKVGHHVGDAAEHAFRRGDAFGERGEPALSRTASMPVRQAACSSIRPRQRSRISSNTGQEIASCGATLSRWVRSALVPWA